MKRSMKRYLTIFASSDLLKIVLYILILLYVRHFLTFIVLILFILKGRDKGELCLFLGVVLLVMLRASSMDIKTNHFVIQTIKENGYIAKGLLYDLKLKGSDGFKIGDVIYVDEFSEKGNDPIDNIYYVADEAKFLFHIPNFRSDLYLKIADEKSYAAEFLKYSLFDLYGDEDFNIFLSAYFLYLLFLRLFKFIFKDKAYLAALFVFFNLWDIDYTFIRIASLVLLKNFIKRKDLILTFSILLFILYNPQSIYSYSFIFPFALRLFLLYKGQHSFKAVILILQSVLFYEVDVISLFFFKYIMSITALFSVLAIISVYLDLPSFIFEGFKILNDLNSFIVVRGQLSMLVIAFYLLFIKSFRIKSETLKLIILFLLVLSNISNYYANVTMIDVGQGDAIYITSINNTDNTLIDTGSEYNYYKLKRFLKRRGVYSLDRLIITHFDKDHSGNIAALLKDFDVKNLVLNGEDVQTKSYTLKSINEKIYDNANDNSSVYITDINGLNFFFSGDISKLSESDLCDKYYGFKIDILKAAHHGSNTSTSDVFLNTFRPKLALISTSGQYAHPHKEVIERLDKWQIPYLCTKENGDIAIIFGKFANFYITGNHEFGIITK